MQQGHPLLRQARFYLPRYPRPTDERPLELLTLADRLILGYIQRETPPQDCPDVQQARLSALLFFCKQADKPPRLPYSVRRLLSRYTPFVDNL